MKKFLILFFWMTQAVAATNNSDFLRAMADIQEYYITPTQTQTLFDNAIRGMVTSLDPHCTYLDPEDYKDLNKLTRGTFGGIGLEITMKHSIIKVVTPIAGSPAAKAGLLPNDEIIRIDNTAVINMTIRTAISLMQGLPGTSVTLTLMRNGVPMKISVKRAIIHVQSVKAKLLDNYGYLQITFFQTTTFKELRLAIQQLQKFHPKGYVLDLRNNPGGLFNSAVDITGLFLNTSLKHPLLIVSTQGRRPENNTKKYATHTKDRLQGSPLVVLINAGTASSAEILAGALHDNKRAILVGERTFGKGSVQTLIPLTQNSALKLTTALYYTPNGTSIQAQGISPDIATNSIEVKNKNSSESSSILHLNEADLPGHLKNPNALNTSVQTMNNLAQEDYTLYQALDILKSMALTEAMNSPQH